MALWTAEVFVDSSVGTIRPTVEAGTAHGARQQIERLYGPVTQIVNLREVRGGGGGGSSSSGGSGCGLLFGVLLLIAAAGLGAFDSDEKKPKPTIDQRTEQFTFPTSPAEAEPQAPQAPPEPLFRDYPTPPPSYCITENFEPC